MDMQSNAMIHYCWFGEEKPDKVLRCIESWRRFEPSAEITEWNESNCNLESSAFFARAFAAKQWAFAADYARLMKLHEFGGVYLDTDIELRAPIVRELSRDRLTLSFEKNCVQGCVIGCERHHPFIGKLLERYDNDIDVGIPGREPKSIVTRITDLLIDEYGLRSPFGEQSLADGIRILPANRLLVDMGDGKNLSIHHYDASWKADFDSYGFTRGVRRYCDWENAPLAFRARERLKVILQYRLPRLYRRIRDGRRK